MLFFDNNNIHEIGKLTKRLLLILSGVQSFIIFLE